MLFAAAGQCGCMAILAGTVFDGGHAAGIVATVMLFLFNFFFGVGLLGVAWLCMFRPSAPVYVSILTWLLVPAEYAPLAIRSRSAALATATNCTLTPTCISLRTQLTIQGSSRSSWWKSPP